MAMYDDREEIFLRRLAALKPKPHPLNPLVDLGQNVPARSYEFEDMADVKPTLMHELRCFFDSDYRLQRLQDTLRDEMRKRDIGTSALFDQSNNVGKEALIDAIKRELNVALRLADVDNMDANDDEMIDADEFHSFVFGSHPEWALQSESRRRRRNEADPNNDVNLLKRDMLRYDPVVRALLRGFWLVCDKDRSGALSKQEYIDYHMNLYAALNVEETRQHGWRTYAKRNAEKEWENDVQGAECLDMSRFMISLFQVADAYIDGEPNKEKLAKFLCFLLDLVTVDTRPDEPADAAPDDDEDRRRIVFRWEVDSAWLDQIDEDATKVSKDTKVALELEHRIEEGAKKMLALTPQLQKQRRDKKKKKNGRGNNKSIDIILDKLRPASKQNKRTKKSRHFGYLASTLATANKYGKNFARRRRHTVDTLPESFSRPPQNPPRRRHSEIASTLAGLKQQRPASSTSLSSSASSKTTSDAPKKPRKVAKREDIDAILDANLDASASEATARATPRRKSFSGGEFLDHTIFSILQDGDIAGLLCDASDEADEPTDDESEATDDNEAVAESPAPACCEGDVIQLEEQAAVVEAEPDDALRDSSVPQAPPVPLKDPITVRALSQKRTRRSSSRPPQAQIQRPEPEAGFVALVTGTQQHVVSGAWARQMAHHVGSVRQTPSFRELHSVFVCGENPPEGVVATRAGAQSSRIRQQHHHQQQKRQQQQVVGGVVAPPRPLSAGSVVPRPGTAPATSKRTLTLQQGAPVTLELKPSMRWRIQKEAEAQLELPSFLCQLTASAAGSAVDVVQSRRRQSLTDLGRRRLGPSRDEVESLVQRRMIGDLPSGNSSSASNRQSFSSGDVSNCRPSTGGVSNRSAASLTRDGTGQQRSSRGGMISLGHRPTSASVRACTPTSVRRRKRRTVGDFPLHSTTNSASALHDGNARPRPASAMPYERTTITPPPHRGGASAPKGSRLVPTNTAAGLPSRRV